jgi:predicted N-acetyltransferase YhbS
LKLRKCTREEFVASLTSEKADKFAKTFIAKADMQEQWDDCLGAFDDDGSLMGAIITTVGKNKVANLQLLHTFYKFRGKGVAKELTLMSYDIVKIQGAKYFRVSSEISAIPFYEKIGFKFWGKQKSGCQLSIFRINGELKDGDYDYNDKTINSAINRKGKGGCVELFKLAIDQKPPNIEEF